MEMKHNEVMHAIKRRSTEADNTFMALTFQG